MAITMPILGGGGSGGMASELVQCLCCEDMSQIMPIYHAMWILKRLWGK